MQVKGITKTPLLASENIFIYKVKLVVFLSTLKIKIQI